VVLFIEDLKTRTGLAVRAWDERLTSVEAEEILMRAGVHGKRRKALVDGVAAAVILQEFLDHRKAAEAAKSTA
jgi:putative Holliday junction resolvase